MIKKTFLLSAVLVFCLTACKMEPDLPDDPHVPLKNPFTGVWYDSDEGEYWQFRTDGTGGRADAEEDPFPNGFSFFIYSGPDVLKTPLDGNLVILDDSGGGLAVNNYRFFIDGKTATLSPEPGPGQKVELEKVSGSPQVLSLDNLLIGEWSADWSDTHGLTWSLKYRSDGTVKTYHHEVRHQFENAYALRGNTLVIFGEMRFATNPVIAEITPLENGKLQVQEKQSNPGPAQWTYTKVKKAEWLD
jgi:hypothetical protein